MLIKNQCEANVTGDFEQQMKIPQRNQEVAMPKTEARLWRFRLNLFEKNSHFQIHRQMHTRLQKILRNSQQMKAKKRRLRCAFHH